MISKTLLKDYANLIAEKGVNVQKGQDVLLYCSVEQPEFAKMVSEALYKRGARKVFVDFYYQPIDLLDYKKRSLKALSELESFEVERFRWREKKLPARIYIISDDPFGMAGAPNEKINRSEQAIYPVIKPFIKAAENKHQWCIASVAGKKWAKRVFPELSSAKAVDALWNAILSVSLVDGSASANWDKHNADIRSHCDRLNSLKIKKLRYTSSNGTDFTVWLNEHGKFHGGADTTIGGVTYNPNIPSYEVFTSPIAGKCEGKVVSTKPLSYLCQLIENIEVTFKDGKVVKAVATKNEELLNQIVKMDECSCMLGEVALVPFDNPINNSGRIYYETLIDENACCHLALGAGFPETLEGFEKMSPDEIRAAGVNDSMIHVDFMIGSRDLKIVAETFDGKEVLIFENGNWA